LKSHAYLLPALLLSTALFAQQSPTPTPHRRPAQAAQAAATPPPDGGRVALTPKATAAAPDGVDLSIKLIFAQQDNLSLQATLLQTKSASTLAEAIAPIQTQFNQLNSLIDAWAVTLKKENGWGADVTFDKATRTFYRSAPPLTPAAAPEQKTETPAAAPAPK
jgi:hypothetical protein